MSAVTFFEIAMRLLADVTRRGGFDVLWERCLEIGVPYVNSDEEEIVTGRGVSSWRGRRSGLRGCG